MPLSDVDLEQLEKNYFDIIDLHVRTNLTSLLTGLSSRHMIFNDWNSRFVSTARRGYNASNLDIGAERIFHNVFSSLHWTPNSAPIGSDLFFETENAFIHIDIKTALLTNRADYYGRVNVGRNQTSYPAYQGTNINFSPNLPIYYNYGTSNEKSCLTYGIQIIHENIKQNILAILLFSIPNGQLFRHYGNLIVNRGKSGFYPKGTRNVKDFRFAYYKNPNFILLQNTPFRVKFVHFDNSQNPNVQKVDLARNHQIR